MLDVINYTDYDFPFTTESLNDWIEKTIQSENKTFGDISLVFGSDDWLLDYNKTYLQHDYYTDIITFDYCENNLVSGDLLISLDRVFDNAISLNVPRETELKRVIIHGVLHLIGYTDKDDNNIGTMRKKENHYMSLF